MANGSNNNANNNAQAPLSDEASKKLEQLKGKLEKFSKKVQDKLSKYVLSISLLPPSKQQEGQQEAPDPNKVNVLVLVDDSDTLKANRQELKDKLYKSTSKIAQGVDKNISPQIVIISELWASCYDSKYELIRLIAMSAPVYDTGMLSAIKISEVHKDMVLKKFEKYIVSYVLSGSLIRGEATETSDIDVFIVIDDTDVKKMTRAELKDKLRAIIVSMGIEAGEITGVRNKLNIQVYILTDFWDSLKEANPIIFTLLRDGVPFYDRGIFMPWKQLLKIGKIKPSTEAIDMFMSSGEQMLHRVKLKLREIGMEDIYYAILTPSQAALMLNGTAPPAPKETARQMREVFVKKEKMISEEDVDILENNIQIRKDLEHGTKKELTGKEVDTLMKDAEKYLKRVQKLFKQIEKTKKKNSMIEVHENTLTLLRDALSIEGVQQTSDKNVFKVFEKEFIDQGLAPEKFRRILHEIKNAKKEHNKGMLSNVQIEKTSREADKLKRFLVEYLDRKKSQEKDKAKMRIKYGEKHAEVTFFQDCLFIVKDIEDEKRQVLKAKLSDKGKVTGIKDSSLEKLDEALGKLKLEPKMFLKQDFFNSVKEIFGDDAQIQVNY